MSEAVKTRRDGKVLEITLDRPPVNAIDAATSMALYEAFHTLQTDDDLLIGIVTGAMNAVVLPELAKFYKAGETGRIVDLWQRAMNKALLV